MMNLNNSLHSFAIKNKMGTTQSLLTLIYQLEIGKFIRYKDRWKNQSESNFDAKVKFF